MLELPLEIDEATRAVQPGHTRKQQQQQQHQQQQQAKEPLGAANGRDGAGGVDLSGLSAEERRKLKKKLQKKRQKAKKKGMAAGAGAGPAATGAAVGGDGENEEEQDEGGEDEEPAGAAAATTPTQNGSGSGSHQPAAPATMAKGEGAAGGGKWDGALCRANLVLPASASVSSGAVAAVEEGAEAEGAARDEVLRAAFATARLELLPKAAWSYPGAADAGRVMVAVGRGRLRGALLGGKAAGEGEDGGDGEGEGGEWVLRLRLGRKAVGKDDDTLFEAVPFLVRDHGPQALGGAGGVAGLRAALGGGAEAGQVGQDWTVCSVRYHTAHMGAVLGLLEQRVGGLRFLSVPPGALPASAALGELALGFAHGTAALPSASSGGKKNGGGGEGDNSDDQQQPPYVVGVDVVGLLGASAHAGLRFRGLDARLRYWREHRPQPAGEAAGDRGGDGGNGGKGKEVEERKDGPEAAAARAAGRQEGGVVSWLI